jgi:hypothetical protein
MAASGLAVSLRLTGGRRRRPPWQGRKYRFGTSEHESVRAILSPGGWATLGRQRERPPVRQVLEVRRVRDVDDVPAMARGLNPFR